MTTTCFDCGKEIGYGQPTIIKRCPECRKLATPTIRKRMSDPGGFLRELLLVDTSGIPAHIIAVESDAGATRVYVASEEMAEQGLCLMHYIRSEEVDITRAARIERAT